MKWLWTVFDVIVYGSVALQGLSFLVWGSFMDVWSGLPTNVVVGLWLVITAIYIFLDRTLHRHGKFVWAQP